MFDAFPPGFSTPSRPPIPRADAGLQSAYAAIDQFNHAYTAGRWYRLWSWITRRSYRLVNLADFKLVFDGHYDAGLQSVEIAAIKGTEGRSTDFDNHFHPVHERMRDRWASIAAARYEGFPLPPITLLKIADLYFVRDGHHRLSVAKNLGQLCIEAEVTVFHTSSPPSQFITIGSSEQLERAARRD